MISEKTKLPLGFLLPLVGALMALAASTAVGQFKTAANSEAVQELKPEVQSHDVRISKHDAVLEGMQETLKRIDRNVERMSRGQ